MMNKLVDTISCEIRKKDDQLMVESEKMKKINRTVETAADLIFHLFLLFCGILLISTQPWNSDLTLLFVNDYLENGVIIFFNVYLAHYCCELISIFDRQPKSDTIVYLIHHIMSIISCSGGYVFGLQRFTASIMYRYEYSDIFLLSGKIARYLDKKCTIKACVLLLTLSWIINRIVWGGKAAIYLYINFNLLPFVDNAFFLISVCGFAVLQILQIFWTFTLLKYVFAIYRGQWDDPRES